MRASAEDIEKLKNSPKRWFVLISMATGLFMAMLDNTIVNVAVPTIRNAFDARINEVQWILDGYTLPFASLMLLGGVLGDVWGRRRLYVIGIIIFMVGSVLSGISSSTGLLILGRVISGAGAAMVIPASLAMVTGVFKANQKATAVGSWAGLSALAIGFGPLIGGWIVENANWQWIFWINLPIGILGIIATYIFAPEIKTGGNGGRIDFLGAAAVTTSLACIVYGLIEANHLGWADLEIVSCFIAGAFLMLIFLMHEARCKNPMMPLELFRNSNFTTVNLIGFTTSFALFGIFLYITIFLQYILGYTPIEAGIKMMPLTVGTFIFAPVAGRLADKIGPKYLMLMGTIGCAVGVWTLTHLTAQSTYSELWPGFLIMGISLSFTLALITTMGVREVSDRQAGLASGIINSFRELGGTFGIAVLGTYINLIASKDFAARLSVERLEQTGVPRFLLSDLREKILHDYGDKLLSAVNLKPGKFPGDIKPIIDVGRESLSFGISRAMLVSAVALILTSLVVFIFLRNKKKAKSFSDMPFGHG